MSYLDFPRLHFSGRFFTNPSTINNDPRHYDPQVKRPCPWQMPDGLHYFRFFDCMVKTAMDENAEPVREKGLVGADVRSLDLPVPAKIVDLDTYMQGVPQILGLELQIGNETGAHLQAKMLPPVLAGCWFKAVLPTRGWSQDYGSAGSYGADSSAIGVFQTVLLVEESNWKYHSRLMDQLKQRCVSSKQDGKTYYHLAFKFVLDGYWNVQGEERYQTGRVVGTIGPLLPNDPTETLGGRWLEARADDENAPWYVPCFYRMPFRVDETSKLLQLDWAGSTSRQTFGGDPVDLGLVEAVVMADEPESLGTFVVDARTYSMRSGITELPLTEKQVELVSKHPLVLKSSRLDIGSQELFLEAENGLSVSAQSRNIRMTSNEGMETTQATASVVIRKFGKPVADLKPKLEVVSVHGGTPGATVPPSNLGNTWQAEGALVAQISKTNSEGVAEIQLEAVKDPGSRTTQLDGQAYFVNIYLGDDAPQNPTQEQQVAVVVWSRFEIQKNPPWEVIREMMVPFAKLYPGMREKMDVSSKTAFDFYSNNPDASFFMGPDGKFDIPGHPEIQDGTIPFLITLPVEDPRYMPVTRDLSPPKVATILNYISNEQQKIKAQAEPSKKEGSES